MIEHLKNFAVGLGIIVAILALAFMVFNNDTWFLLGLAIYLLHMIGKEVRKCFVVKCKCSKNEACNKCAERRY